MFALFHDDVMDGSATRRGTRTTEQAQSSIQNVGLVIGKRTADGDVQTIFVANNNVPNGVDGGFGGL